MYSIFGGACTFNTTKWICQLIVPLMALIQPILPLAMAQTLIIQAFGSFYVGINMCRTNVERGVAGITAGAIATCANPSYGLFVGIALCIVMEIIGMSKKERQAEQEGLSRVHRVDRVKSLFSKIQSIDLVLFRHRPGSLSKAKSRALFPGERDEKSPLPTGRGER